MTRLDSFRPAFWVLVALLSAAAGLVAYDIAIAADSAGAQAAKDSVSATLRIRPDKFDFGQVIVPLISTPLTVTATNKSKSTSTNFTSIVASSPFSIQSDGCSGSPLAAGRSCEVKVVFHPTATGPVKNKQGVTFTDSAKKSPQNVALAGRGIVGSTPTPTAIATPTASATPTITATPTLTITMTPTVTFTPSPAASATCTIRPSATPDIEHLVLIAGGQAANGTPLNTAEVFNPATNIFTLTTALGGSAMNDARYSHGAAANGTTGAQVLVSGGFDATGVAKSTETFISGTHTFIVGPDMTDSREGHTATAFDDDSTDVLIAGGQNNDGTVLKSAEVKVGTATGSMNTPRMNAAAALFAEPFTSTCPAKAVVTGGSDGVTALQTAELFDPTNNTFTLTDDASLGGSQMNAARAFHTATLLRNSGTPKVLMAGGEGVAGVAQASAEVFDVGTKKFTLTTGLGGTDMTATRAKHTAIAFDQTLVLIAGGIDSAGKALATAEVFDLATATFTAVGSMHSARFDHAAALLPSGKVLITGGDDGSGTALNTAEIFDPATDKFTLTTDASLGGNNMNVARKLHTATAY